MPKLFRSESDIDDLRYFWKWFCKKTEAPTHISARIDNAINDAVVWAEENFKPTPEVPFVRRAGVGGRIMFRLSLTDAQQKLLPSCAVFSPRPTAAVEDAQVYLKAVKRTIDNEERIETLLREIDGRVKRVRAFSDERTSRPMLHVGLQSGLTLPATQLGQGFNRIMRIYSALLSAEADVFLIDEVETGLHHDVLATVWKGLAAVARQGDVQIFATTHSREAILAAHQVFAQEPEYDFAYHRLERDAQGEIQVVTYDQEALTGADDANFEVR